MSFLLNNWIGLMLGAIGIIALIGAFFMLSIWYGRMARMRRMHMYERELTYRRLRDEEKRPEQRN